MGASLNTERYLEEVLKDAATRLLGWFDDWDGEGSPAYHTETLERVKGLLLRTARALQYATLPMPIIENGPDGSIDVSWFVRGRELLLNVPVDPAEGCDYYGRGGDDEVRGTLAPGADCVSLMEWLLGEGQAACGDGAAGRSGLPRGERGER